MIDLGHVGILILGIIKERNKAIFTQLDRTLANQLWLNIYPNSFLQNLPIFGSDHAPILLNASVPGKNYHFRFKFEAK